ncbi:hypothetical protein LZ554_008048 [Drepanopeziza brunnea f. sp. 'monogermtubi']|nr:hypothetical protein LZ554_008048 [Drepanopeziza brunnea f. sp. 'monogermtubi']
MTYYTMQQSYLVVSIRDPTRRKKNKPKVATSLFPKNNLPSKAIEPLHSADTVKTKKTLRERFGFLKSSVANKDLVPENLVPENLVSEDLVPEDSVPEDSVPEDLVSEDFVSEDFVSEDFVSEDFVSEDFVSEDLVPEDLPSKVDSEPEPAANELPSLQEQLALSPTTEGTSIASISTTSTEWERFARANTPTHKPPPNPRRVAAMLAAQAAQAKALLAAEAQPSQLPETPKIDTAPVNSPKISVHSSVDESGSFAAHQSFLTRTIQLLVTEHPSIESELRALEKTIREHEFEMSSAKATDEAAMHTKVWDALVKSETLEKRLLGKDELVQSLYIKIDGHENTIRTQNQAVKDLRNRIHILDESIKQMGRDSRTRVHNLEETIKQKDRDHRTRVHTLEGTIKQMVLEFRTRIQNLEEAIKQKDRSLDHSRRDYSSAVVRLEREKRALVEQTGVLEEQLETQKTMTRNLQANAQRFKVYAKDMAQSYDFYRSHYDKYKKYFAQWDENEKQTSDGTHDGDNGPSSQDKNGGGAGVKIKSLSESAPAGTGDPNISRSSSTNESHAEGGFRDLEHDSTLVGEDLN